MSPSSCITAAENSYITTFLQRSISSGDVADNTATVTNTSASYGDYCLAKRQRNEKRLREIGLLQAALDLKDQLAAERTKKQPRVRSRYTISEDTDTTSRRPTTRSAVRKNEGVKLLEESTSKEDQRFVDESPEPIRKRPRMVQRQKEFNPEEHQQKAVLLLSQPGVTTDSLIDEMHDFLLAVPHGRGHKTISQDNARAVIRQVRLLTSGEGITYHHWKEGVVFAKDRRIDLLSTNFDELLFEAKQFEVDNGKDRGNGWLLQHPITKMQIYQEYLLSS
mmetsp:Transcript_18390/g.26130  ORF Transcript_18390/g.26130 Transcript_18390/m.26130 type:complete len:278 (+) Transcript_18390:80-913(+)